jgi:hypothetical protein
MLKLIETKVFGNGVVMIRYSAMNVKTQARPGRERGPRLRAALLSALAVLWQGCAHVAGPAKTVWGPLPPDTATPAVRSATYTWRSITQVSSDGMVVGGKPYPDAAIADLFRQDGDRAALSQLRRSRTEARLPLYLSVLIPLGSALGAGVAYYSNLSNTGNVTYTSDITPDFSHTRIFSTATSADYTRGALIGAAAGALIWLEIAWPLWYAAHHGRAQAADGYNRWLQRRLRLEPGQAGVEVKF